MTGARWREAEDERARGISEVDRSASIIPCVSETGMKDHDRGDERRDGRVKGLPKNRKGKSAQQRYA